MDSITYTCIAIDDEAPALDKIKRFISKVPFLTLKASFDNALSAMAYLKSHKTDIMFLDIQMDELTGLQLIELLDNKPIIILTTAYGQYALKGYELDVSDYLLKPYSFERFLKAVNKAIKPLLSALPNASKPDKEVSTTHDYIFVKTEYRLQKILMQNILYIEGMKDYLKIVMQNDYVMTLMNFATILAMLPEEKFIRVHKSYVVAIDKIECVERDRIIINKERLPIGETYKSNFLNFISGTEKK